MSARRGPTDSGGKKILITGAGGMVAAELVPRLAAGREIVLWDREPVSVASLTARAVDITDLRAVRNAMAGFDAVVHLAIASYREILFNGSLAGKATPEALDRFHAAMMRVNNDGTLNLMKAASEAKVPRFVFMSSLTVVSQGLATGSISTVQPPVPRDIYACTKVFGESLGKFFSMTTGMRVACLRLGQPYPVDHPDLVEGYRERLGWLVHHDDTAAAVARALEEDIPPFSVANLVSAQADGFYPESEICSNALGFRPRRRIGADGQVEPLESEVTA